MEELINGVVIKMMSAIHVSNTLVVTEKDTKEDGIKTKRVKPVVWFKCGNWKTIPNDVINSFKPFGYYLVAIPWTIKKPSMVDDRRISSGLCHVLHCVRKEHPIVKFGGKVGPMSSFAPRVDGKGIQINGYYVGYHWNGNESLEEIPNHFNGKFTLKGRKVIPKNQSLVAKRLLEDTTVRRLGVIVGKDGYCVGMEVRLAHFEEKARRRIGEYHHTRPIILENGFYIFDGIFRWQPIHSNLETAIKIPTDISSPLIFLAEGIHLITSTKDITNIPEGEKYRRLIQICPSLESEHISIVDWDIFEKDFLI